MMHKDNLTEAELALENGELEKSLTLYQELLETNFVDQRSLWNFGLCILLSGDNEQADFIWTSALFNNPSIDTEQYFSDLVHFLKEKSQHYINNEKYNYAKIIYLKILESQPNNIEILQALADIYEKSRNRAEVIPLCKRIIELDENNFHAWKSLARTLRQENDIEESIACYNKCITKGLVDEHLLSDFGVALMKKGEYEEAILMYEKSLEFSYTPCTAIRKALSFPLVSRSVEEINVRRNKLEEELKRLINENFIVNNPEKEIGLSLFELAYQGYETYDIQYQVAQLFEKSTPSLLWSSPHLLEPLSTNKDDEKIKIGFVSGFLINHTIGKLFAGIITKLPREIFSVYVFSFSDVKDEVSKFIRDHSDNYVVLPQDLQRAREAISLFCLDILFYPDIGMWSFTYFLAFSRLAHVQLVSWGHPLSTGIRNIDYFLSCKDLETSYSEKKYHETLIQMDNLPVFYYKPYISNESKSRKDFGLSDEQNIYSCPQSLFKFHPDFDIFLQEILDADPLGILVLLEGPNTQCSQILKTRLSHKISNIETQVKFLPRLKQMDFLWLVKNSDVMLDPIYFGGGNTTYEALSFGVPIVTLPGESMRARVTYACYKTMEFTDCIASNQSDYVKIATQLGTDPKYRNYCKEEILRKNHVLYKNESAILEMGQCLKNLLNNRLATLTP